MKKILIAVFLAFIILAVAVYIFGRKEYSVLADYKNTTYTIDGQSVLLQNGVASTSSAPGSASMTTTQYFGNEVRGDFNNDGKEDVAFLLTQNGGGSGTFYYVVVALNTNKGFVGTNAILLGDRIAPESTEYQQGKIIVNYADRAQWESLAILM